MLPPKKREPKFLAGPGHEQRRRGFVKHEKAVASGIGGAATIGSGNKGMKGDVHGGNRDAGQRIMAEAKSTEHSSISLKLAWLVKLMKEAFDARMEPALFIRFSAIQNVNDQDWAVIPKNRYEELLELEAAVKLGQVDRFL